MSEAGVPQAKVGSIVSPRLRETIFPTYYEIRGGTRCTSAEDNAREPSP